MTRILPDGPPTRPRRRRSAIATALVVLGLASGGTQADWRHYGGDPGGMHYSPLAQIDRGNVGRLRQAWTYQTGELARHPDRKPLASFHATPLLLPRAAGQSLVFCTPFNRIIALDPVTGAERWVFDPGLVLGPPGTRFNCRGIAWWEDLEAATDAPCRHRLYMGTGDLRLFAIDARDGRPCAGFGEDGRIDLRPAIVAEMEQRLGEGAGDDLRHGDIQFVSPPVLAGDVLVIGSTNNTKFRRPDGPAGTVRAFDARSGAPRWEFDPVPRNPGDPAAAGWEPEALARTGGANAWSMLSVDEERGLVFVPTASAGPDFFGGLRPGDNRYANSLVALRAATGEVAWHYQMVHHDVWDLDLPAQPILFEMRREGEHIPAVAQLTKMGLIFVFHRETGQPLFPIEERPVPQDGVPGEQLSPTQPFPLRPPPLVTPGMGPEDTWGFTFFDQGWCRRTVASARHGGYYQPPSREGTVMFPGAGVNNWGGGALDPNRQLLVVPVNRAPTLIQLLPVADLDEGMLANPMAGLMGIPGRLAGTPWAQVFKPLLSPLFSPCNAPPWGELVAVDMAAGEIRWRVTLGVLDKLMPVPIPLRWGTPTSGGPIATAGGLVFIGATMDERFRAFDIETGEELWEAFTPTASMATPMTYEVDGRQYVVVASGGHMWQYGFKIGDWLVAFALDE
jgi:quinoprotein glucose dehydrogenase